jgi:hypothetical protein
VVESSKEQRRRARERVAEYHEAGVAELLTYVAAAIDSYRSGGLNVTETNAAIHQYHRATQELWKFCFSISDVEFVAQTINALTQPVDWWQRGEPRRPK